MAATDPTLQNPAAPTPTPTTAAQPWAQAVTVPNAPTPAAMASPGLLGPTNTATAATNTPTLLSDQVNKVTDPNSPIMQRATAAANEASNDKGLLNSSMAVGSAQNAVLQAAVPIATGDINALNTAGLATQQQQSQASLSNAQQANAMQTAQAQLSTQANLQNASSQNAQIMSKLGQENQVQLSQLGNQYQSFLNTNANASTLYNNALAQMGNIQSNPNIDATQKTIQIQQLMAYLQSGLSMMSATSGLNLGAGLNFAPSGAAASSAGGALPTPAGQTPAVTTPGMATGTAATGLLGGVAGAGSGTQAAATSAAQQAYDAKVAALVKPTPPTNNTGGGGARLARTRQYNNALVTYNAQLAALGPRPA